MSFVAPKKEVDESECGELWLAYVLPAIRRMWNFYHGRYGLARRSGGLWQPVETGRTLTRVSLVELLPDCPWSGSYVSSDCRAESGSTSRLALRLVVPNLFGIRSNTQLRLERGAFSMRGA